MAFTPKEQEIIQYGLKNGKSKEEVTQALTNLRMGITPKKAAIQDKTVDSPNVVDNIMETVKTGADTIKQDIQDTKIIPSIKPAAVAENTANVLQTAGHVAGTVAGTAGGMIGSVLSSLIPDSVKSTVSHITDSIPGLPIGQETKDILSKKLDETLKNPDNKQIEKGIMDIFNTVSLLGGSKAVPKTGEILTKAKELTDGVSKLKETISDSVPSIKTVVDKVVPTSEEIMNKVARLNPTDANNFQNISNGVSHGEYLSKTGNFGSPEKIIANEAKKFTDSLNQVDKAMETLPGVYKTQPLQSMADALVERARKVSTPGAESPYLKEAINLQNKLNKDGITMKETNNLKRLFEKNVKLGYKLEQNPSMVEQATNIDTAVRKWQASEASKLGFENLSELNKQTQISKFIVDKLGSKLTGQTGLNAVTLTDWIMLSGGNPTSVAGLLVKKVFSSKSIQAKIAEMLAKGDSIPAIQAKLKITPSNIERSVSPTGAKQLSAPVKGAPKNSISGGTTIPVAPKGFKGEMTSKEGIIPSKQATPPQPKRLLEKPSFKSTTIQKKVNGVTPETNLISEAKKYKSAEDFVKAQGTPIYHGSNEKINVFSNKKGAQGVIWFTDNPKAITAGESGAQGTKFINERVATGKKFAGWDEYEKLGLGQIKDMGFDGIKLPTKMQDGTKYNDYVLFDNKTLKTKSQLTDIWKKANKK